MKKSYQLLAISYQLISFVLWALWSGLCYAQEQDPPLSYYEIIEQRNFFRPKKDFTDEYEKKTSFAALPSLDEPTSVMD